MRIPDVVSNATIGSMRMQFWRETIDRVFKHTPPHEPVAILLHYALKSLQNGNPGVQTKSLKTWLTRVINTREQYMDNRPFPTMAALETYAENTYSSLLYATLGFLPMHSLAVDHVASHIGKAAGISAVLRGMPIIAFPAPPTHHSNSGILGAALGGDSGGRQGSVILPLDVMAQCGVVEEQVLREGGAAKGLEEAVFTVATRANDHLITAREMMKRLAAGEDAGHEFEHAGEEGHEHHLRDADEELRNIHPLLAREKDTKMTAVEELDRGFGVLMQAVPTRLWLERLEKANFDIFKPEVRSRGFKLPWSAYWAYKRKQI
jgi:NADH dehydrogenase [ubiquinone] 1 alpha subcomplex assembly factor 6